jgi:molecular chaperone GrpE
MMSSKQEETPSEAQKAKAGPSVSVAEATGQSDEESGADDTDMAAVSDATAESTRIAILEAELAAVREELSMVNDKYLRKLADDVNFRKRMAREKEDGQRFAVVTLLGDLIPILDDFDRAIASAETQKEYAVLHDGVTIIRRQLGSVLESKYGLTKFAALGQPFDPNRHEAVAMVQGGPEDGDEAIVAEEFLPGYGLHDRILRTAKVRVRMPSQAAQSAPKADAQEAAPAADKQEN